MLFSNHNLEQSLELGPNKLVDDDLTLNFLDISGASKKNQNKKKSRITVEMNSIQLINLTDNCHT